MTCGLTCSSILWVAGDEREQCERTSSRTDSQRCIGKGAECVGYILITLMLDVAQAPAAPARSSYSTFCFIFCLSLFLVIETKSLFATPMTHGAFLYNQKTQRFFASLYKSHQLVDYSTSATADGPFLFCSYKHTTTAIFVPQTTAHTHRAKSSFSCGDQRDCGS